jgi:hypothetical protein
MSVAGCLSKERTSHESENSTPLEHRIKAENHAVLHDVPDRAQMSDNG